MNNASSDFRVDRLIKRRKELNMKSVELARLCDVSAVQMSRIETGERGVTLDMLVKFSKYLGCSADWLLGIDNDAPRTQVEHWIKLSPKA